MYAWFTHIDICLCAVCERTEWEKKGKIENVKLGAPHKSQVCLHVASTSLVRKLLLGSSCSKMLPTGAPPLPL